MHAYSLFGSLEQAREIIIDVFRVHIKSSDSVYKKRVLSLPETLEHDDPTPWRARAKNRTAQLRLKAKTENLEKQLHVNTLTSRLSHKNVIGKNYASFWPAIVDKNCRFFILTRLRRSKVHLISFKNEKSLKLDKFFHAI